MKKLYLLLAIACLVPWGCSKDSPTKTENNGNGSSSVLLPLKVGNFWEYETDGPFGQRYRYKWNVIRQISIASEQAFVVAGAGPDTAYLVNKELGVYIYSRNRRKFELLWKYPAKVSETFVSNVDRQDYLYNTTTKSTDASVSVPAGVFKECVMYEQFFQLTNHTETSRVYVKPGIGFVKEEYIYSNDSPNITELISYKVN